MSDKKVSVGLDLRNSESGSAPGYTTVTAANGQSYYYKYSGGDDGNGNADNGNVSVKQGKKTEVTVTVGSDPRYKVGGVFVNNDPDNDITVEFNGTQVTLTDSATDLEDNIYYRVTVCDTTANTFFDCDPTIKNVPDNN
jgi:hypothetical protein